MSTVSKSWKKAALIAIAFILAISLSACGSGSGSSGGSSGSSGSSSSSSGGSSSGGSGSGGGGGGGDDLMMTIEELVPLAQQEGRVDSVGMPDHWANWKETWEDLKNLYGIDHSDTDMSSAEEINKFDAEKNNPTADIGDVGIQFGPMAVDRGVTQPFKTQFWDEIPDWAKDSEGHWIVGYTGSIAIICNKEMVSNCPKSWNDMLNNNNGSYQVAIGDALRAAQAQMSILAAAIAHGGDESNLQPGYDWFIEMAKRGQLSKLEPRIPQLEAGEVTVALMWDFNALNYATQINRDRFEIVIPEEGTVTSGYATIINKWAPHPNAAKLARAYILSDKGQINLAKGFARPIRENVQLPPEVAALLLPNEQYKNAKPVGDYSVWEESAKEIPTIWSEEVLIHVK
mgnify:CR=1 FL=1